MSLIHTIMLANSIKIGEYVIFNSPDFLELVIRFTFNLSIILLLVRWLYYSVAKRKDYLITYMLISTVVFLLCYLLESVKLRIGFALGLFAIFGIIRYRTDTMPIKEMTYLFIVIGLSVINALFDKKTSISEIVFTNAVIILITYGYEKIWLLKHESAKTIIYDKIALIKPENYSQLIDDLVERTGIRTINRVEIGRIDLLRDTCRLKIYYNETGQWVNIADQEDNVVSYKDDDD